MAIIKEKSMGCHSSQPSIHMINQQKILRKKKIIKKISFTGFSAIILSFCIYCQTTIHISEPPMEEVHKGSDPLLLNTTEIPVPRDMSSLQSILKIPYAQELQGVFYEESDFDSKVFLTFDDGPNMESMADFDSSVTVTDHILNTLKERNLKAAFFINGKYLEYEDETEREALKTILLRMINEGHLLGNHSYNHHNLARGEFINGDGDLQDIAAEFDSTEQALMDVLGFPYPLVLIRPPYAEPGRTGTLDQWLLEEQKYLISLQFDSYDYAYKEEGHWNQENIVLRISDLLEKAPQGGVLLLHDLDSTAHMLPDILDIIQKKGLSYETLDALLEKKYGRDKSPAA